MYSIYVNPDGTCHCVGMVQDGNERWTCPSLTEAVKSMKAHARYANHDKITKKHIRFFRSKMVSRVEWEEFTP